MTQHYSSILLIVKAHNEQALACAHSIEKWLKKRKVRVALQSSRVAPEQLRQAAFPMTEHGKAVDAVLVLGGDGAMLEVARAFCGLHIPLLGVNFGRVGFLTEISPDGWEEPLSKLLDGGFQLHSYSILHWQLSRGDVVLGQGCAVNDAVLARGAVARTVSLELNIDGAHFSHLRCDGVILSSPLGATGYTLSARGPLLFPHIEALVVTPLSPFAGAFPPLVLPGTACIRLTTASNDVFLTIDGQESIPAQSGDVLEVHGLPDHFHLLTADKDWYIHRLTERGFILSGPGTYGDATAD